MPRKTQIDADQLKQHATGRWPQIIQCLAPVTADSLDGRHHPCPRCGGADRFSVFKDFAETGGMLCRQCHDKGNGDGISSIMWLTGWDFPTAAGKLAAHLGVEVPTTGRGRKRSKTSAKVAKGQETSTTPETPTGGTKAKPAKQSTKTKSKRPPVVYAHQKYLLRALFRKLTPRGSDVPARLAKTYGYGGQFWVLRIDLPTPPGEKQRKTFRPCWAEPRTDEIEGYIWRMGYPDGPRQLFRLAQLETADKALAVVCGGEKAVEAAVGLGLVTTTNAGGEAAISQTDWKPLIAFDRVVVSIDNDDAGRKFGHRVAKTLRTLKPDLSVRILLLPDLPAKGDIVEWIQAGGTRAKFLQLAAEAPDAKSVALAALEVLEAADDPDRLARTFHKAHEALHIRCRSKSFHQWDRRFTSYSREDVRCDLHRSTKAEFNRIHLEARMSDDKSDDDDRPKTVRKVTRRIVADVMSALESQCKVPDDTEWNTWLDGTDRPNCIAMQNGILDLDALLAGRNDHLLPHTPEWFSQVLLPYAFEPRANAETWRRVIHENMGGDKELIAILQEWAGYQLIHDTSEQKFMVCEGEGANGKSVYCAALTAMLGVSNVSHVPLEIVGQRFALTPTLGKLANIAAECGEIDKVAEGYLKSFTSGDRMLFDRKGLPAVEAAPTARVTLATNNRPRFSDKTGGLWRRMILVKFANTVPPERQIRGMDKPEWWERSGELPGIFNWAIVGLYRLRKQGRFTRSVDCERNLEQYQLETNPARAFLQEKYEHNYEGRSNTVDVYRAYVTWCRDMGYRPLSESQFGKEVARAFPNSKKRRIGSGRDRFYAYEGVVPVGGSF